MSCSRSTQRTSSVVFYPHPNSGQPLNSAIFKAGAIYYLLNEDLNAECITVRKYDDSVNPPTLIMWLSDDSGNKIDDTTIISAAFPCPEDCGVKTLSITSLIPDNKNIIFCRNHLIDVLLQSNGVSGVAFHLLNNTTHLGMYGVKINSASSPKFTRFSTATTHKVYTSAIPT